MIRLFYVLIASIALNFNAYAQPPAGKGKPQKFSSISIQYDPETYQNIKASADDIKEYIKNRSDLKDTIGKLDGIIKIITSAKRSVYLRTAKSYQEALVQSEASYVRRTAIDNILVIKHLRKMHLQKKGKTIRSFTIALGPKPTGQKEFEGDGRTPEGIYTINWTTWRKSGVPSYHISYPNAEDIARAKRKNLVPGSNIMIHDTSPGVKKSKDWTNGCIALSNSDFTTFRNMVFQDTRIEIVK